MNSHTITQFLELAASGDPSAQPKLLEAVYSELYQLARLKLANERPGQLLQPTALVNETYLKLFGSTRSSHFENRAHFFGAAAEAMRRILVDQARRALTQKRGGRIRPVSLEDVSVAATPAVDDQTLAVSEALDELESRDPRAALVVKLRFFVGLTLDETADALDLAASTVSADWTAARAWLRYRLRPDSVASTEDRSGARND